MKKKIIKYKNLFTIIILTLSQIFLLFYLPGCSKSNIINEDKFVKIYTDLIIAQDTVNSLGAKLDSTKIQVFKRYDITENEYKNTINYYNQDPSKWEKFFDKVTAYVEKLRKKKGK